MCHLHSKIKSYCFFWALKKEKDDLTGLLIRPQDIDVVSMEPKQSI